jgi:hypothetical protein
VSTPVIVRWFNAHQLQQWRQQPACRAGHTQLSVVIMPSRATCTAQAKRSSMRTVHDCRRPDAGQLVPPAALTVPLVRACTYLGRHRYLAFFRLAAEADVHACFSVCGDCTVSLDVSLLSSPAVTSAAHRQLASFLQGCTAMHARAAPACCNMTGLCFCAACHHMRSAAIIAHQADVALSWLLLLGIT